MDGCDNETPFNVMKDRKSSWITHEYSRPADISQGDWLLFLRSLRHTHVGMYRLVIRNTTIEGVESWSFFFLRASRTKNAWLIAMIGHGCLVSWNNRAKRWCLLLGERNSLNSPTWRNCLATVAELIVFLPYVVVTMWEIRGTLRATNM